MTTNALSLLMLLSLMLITGCSAFRVYDCGKNETRYDVIDLHEPEPCEEAERQFKRGENVRVQLLKTQTNRLVKGFQCKVTMTREVTRCGLDSIQYGSQFPVLKRPIRIIPEECRKATQTQRMVIDNRYFHNLTLGVTNHIQYYRYGSVDQDGNCEHQSFRSGGIQFHRSYKRTELDIRIEIIRGHVDTATGTIRFANRIRARFRDGVVKDDQEGTIVWHPEDPDCHEETSEVYLGPATRYSRQASTDKNLESLIMVQNNNTNQYAGLLLENPTSVCTVHGYTTQIPGLVVLVLRDGDSPLPQAFFQKEVDIGDSHVQSQLSYLHLSTNLDMSEKLATLWAQLCEVNRASLHNKLQAIAATGNPYSIADTHGSGYSTYTAGAVAYIAQCQPEEATIRPYNNCTHEIPIRIGEREAFADPITKIIKEFPTTLVCDDFLPVRWKIGGDWYCGTPRVHRCPAPRQLTTKGFTFRETDFTQGLGHSLYTTEQLEAHRRFQLISDTRGAVWAKVTTAATDTPMGHLRSPPTADDITELGETIADQFLPMMQWFGNAFSDIVGALLILSGIKILVGSAVRAYLLIKKRGVGWWLLASVWHTAFLVVMTPVTTLKRAYQDMVALVEEAGEMPENNEAAPLYRDLQIQLEDLQLRLNQIQTLRAHNQGGQV